MLNESLSKRLNSIMVDRKISNTELAKNLSMPIQTIQKIRTGSNENPTISTLRAIAEYFKITVSQLIGDEPMARIEVPILNWNQILSWPNLNDENFKVSALIPRVLENKVFAIIINDDNYADFLKDEILLIDPSLQIKRHCYALVNRVGQTNPSIKKVLEEDGVFYLKSLIPGITNTILLNNEYSILGVVISSYKLF